MAIRVVYPYGLPVSVVACERGVRRVLLGQRLALQGDSRGAEEMAAQAAGQLEEYFAGQRSEFRTPVEPEGLTEFQRAVLDVCCLIPYAIVTSYGALAAAVAGSKGAARAVGQALACNPTPVLVPCHRVVRGDGGLGGFSAGLFWKRRLLALERGEAPLEG